MQWQIEAKDQHPMCRGVPRRAKVREQDGPLERTTARATAETQSEGEEQAIETDVSMGFKLPIDLFLSKM